jgi:hypothetical protein
MTDLKQDPPKLKPLWRALIEITFVIFLFYANLLMGEFTSANSRGKSLLVAIRDIFTVSDFAIAILAAIVGYLFFEYLRKKI